MSISALKISASKISLSGPMGLDGFIVGDSVAGLEEDLSSGGGVGPAGVGLEETNGGSGSPCG